MVDDRVAEIYTGVHVSCKAPLKIPILGSQGNLAMPELSRFYGIVIRMYCEVGPHHAPHFHAYYGDDEAVYGLDPIELLAGSLPRRQARLVEAWAELRQSELIADWSRLQAGTDPLPIDPLP